MPTARFRLEEALRLGVDDDGVRVLLVRRLRLGRLPGHWARGAEWNAQVEQRMRAFSQRAVHALSPSAAQSDAVFFRSQLEARTALIALLASGRRPIGWFWRLAVPVWSDVDWAEGAPALLRDLLRHDGGKAALARLTARALNEGFAPALVAPITETFVRTLWPELVQCAPEPLPAVDAESHAPVWQSAIDARRTVAALSPAANEAFRAILLGNTGRPMLRRMVAATVVLLRSPQLLSTPAGLVSAVDAVLVVAASPDPPRSRLAAPSYTEASAPASVDGTSDGAGLPPRPDRLSHYPQPSPASAPQGSPHVPAAPDAARPHAIAASSAEREREPWDEVRSDAAGLFLLIWPLARLGLPAWLESHPEAAANGFPWALFHDIARRMRVPPDDPLWSLLPAAEADQDRLRAWRAGLDRWLRRRTGNKQRAPCSLASVVRRQGWFGGDENATVVRFPLAAADIRLRRLALDIDPGWVPWLGRSVTFVYRDRLTE